MLTLREDDDDDEEREKLLPNGCESREKIQALSACKQHQRRITAWMAPDIPLSPLLVGKERHITISIQRQLYYITGWTLRHVTVGQKIAGKIRSQSTLNYSNIMDKVMIMIMSFQ
jgi:hypothetical protein